MPIIEQDRASNGFQCDRTLPLATRYVNRGREPLLIQHPEPPQPGNDLTWCEEHGNVKHAILLGNVKHAILLSGNLVQDSMSSADLSAGE
eukprot:CAMPEP_0115355504 /NCGR_PEP_ID=MMETSP0270-20121206/99136_1 /TAXON_ID=71861 /ORGANISM="Scrippsiella trochoidea, Strain CCMP3099" /LENGTH=89 /DNA_ID=CAMNT_0002777871 /DNA_START=709 /DNA_END=974 /DNA_ORIENTATION=-